MDAKTEQFVQLIEAAGWSQAEAARRLQITPGAVSQIFSGKTRPRAATLNLLKLIVGRENPETLKRHERARVAGLAPWESDLLGELRGLSVAERDRLLAVFSEMIKAMRPKGHG